MKILINDYRVKNIKYSMLLYNMAEIAIPLVVLGSMYVMSNQEKDKTKTKTKQKITKQEGFTNINQNTKFNVPHNNTNKVLVNDKNLPLLNQYNNSNQFTDKYYDENTVYKFNNKDENTSVNNILSLTGEMMSKDAFKHNNMQPFFGAKRTGASCNDGLVESRMDHMTGSGSQILSKNEAAPLFQPHNNMHHIHGTPSTSDFLQSRMNGSLKNANVVPWKKEQVGPGLNQGFSTNGSGGFNTGMEARDLWQPKTVDELRVDTNPKLTFGLHGHEGPLNNHIKDGCNTKHLGNLEKYGPDTHYTVGPQRWFTTTGAEKGQTVRSNEMLQEQNRATTNKEYYGVSNDGNGSYIQGKVQPTRRPVLATTDCPPTYAPGTQSAGENDYSKDSYQLLPNARSTSEQPDNCGGIYGMARAVVAPLLDILRPSKKENVIGNIRLNGNVQNSVSANQIYNPSDRTKTTIRETLPEKNHLNVENQGATGYLVNPQQSITNNRMNTSTDYIGTGGSSEGVKIYDSAYRQRNNVNRQTTERYNGGNMQTFNNYQNISIAKKEDDRLNNRMCVPQKTYNHIPTAQTHGMIHVPQYYENNVDTNRIDADLLSAFKNNPYTQSLNSY